MEAHGRSFGEQKSTTEKLSMKRVLFICTHNSARSQMAEGLLKCMAPGKYEVFSCGTQPAFVNPHAIKAMNEINIDISHHYSNSVEEFVETHFDIVVTVCDSAKEKCPLFFDAKRIIHHSFEDPSDVDGTEEEIMVAFRRVRDEIKVWIAENF